LVCIVKATGVETRELLALGGQRLFFSTHTAPARHPQMQAVTC